MEPTLTIVIPAYNVETFILDAVQSALGQTYRSFEVVAVDDGSTDGTAALLSSIQDPRLRVVHQQNRGLSGARNTGIRHARGKYIGFLDGDDLWLPNKAERQVTLMESDADIGITFSNSRFIDESGTATGGVLFSRSTQPTLAQMVRRNRVGNGSSPIVRAECFVQAGLFEESLRSCEDWEMWVRILRETPFSARLVPEVLTSYRINTSSLSMNFDKFLDSAERASAKVRRETPQVPARIHREALAAHYRITATKALYNGQRPKSVRLLAQAFQVCPWLLAVDPRAWVTLAMVPFNQKAAARVRTLVGRAVRPPASRSATPDLPAKSAAHTS